MSLRRRLEISETHSKRLEKDLNELQTEESETVTQLRRALAASQEELSVLEKKHQCSMEKSERVLRNVKRSDSNLTARLRIFKQYGISPAERAFQTLLVETKKLLSEKGIRLPSCFFSYAWNQDKAENELLQGRILQYQRDLDHLGIKSFVDLQQMKGSMRKCMRENIEKSDFIIIFGTRQYVERALCPDTNVAYELKHIFKKLVHSPHSVIPLIFEGSDPFASLPPDLHTVFFHDIRDASRYQDNFASLTPLGLLPSMLPALRGGMETIEDLHHTYTRIWGNYKSQISLIETQLRLEMINLY